MTEPTFVHDVAGTIEAELEYRVRTVVAHVRSTDKHDEPYPSDWVNSEIRAGRERVRALLALPAEPTVPTERMVPWSRIHAVLEQTSDLYPERRLLGGTHPVQDAVEITHRALFKEVLDVPTGGFDIEAYAGAHNDGFDAAVAQELQDHPAAFAAALRAAADRVEQDAALEPLVTVKHDPRCATMTTLLPTSPPKPAPCTCGADRG